MQTDPITDANGNPVSGATVVARNGSNVYTATTNSSGVANFDSVPDGTYDVYAYKQNGLLLTSQMKRYTQSGGGGDPGGKVVITESFDKSDGAGLGPDLVWDTVGGTWFTSGGRGVGTITGTAAIPQTLLASASQYAQVMWYGQVRVGVCVRMSNDGSEGIRLLRISPNNGGGVGLYLIEQGSSTSIKEESEQGLPALDAIQTLRIEVDDQPGGQMNVRGYINSNLVIEYVGPTRMQNNRRVGVQRAGSNGEEGMFDDFEAGDL